MTAKTPKKTVFDISAGRKYQKPNLSSGTGGGYVENMDKPRGMKILLRDWVRLLNTEDIGTVSVCP
ncbi:hypothetical protein [Oscillibacter sp. GMB15532]|uniref:hypothetical protein n=1 Tax=Oscillibacter sp. GMB15532 TaxID=3230022 RepID=UPI0034DE1785